MQIRDIQITENKIVAVTADNNLYIDNLYHELKKYIILRILMT